MISRKIWKELEDFRLKNGTVALLVDGARQVGKTYNYALMFLVHDSLSEGAVYKLEL